MEYQGIEYEPGTTEVKCLNPKCSNTRTFDNKYLIECQLNYQFPIVLCDECQKAGVKVPDWVSDW